MASRVKFPYCLLPRIVEVSSIKIGKVRDNKIESDVAFRFTFSVVFSNRFTIFTHGICGKRVSIFGHFHASVQKEI